MQNKAISCADKACKKHWKQEITVKTAQNKTEPYKMCLFESQTILFCKRAGTVGIKAIMQCSKLKPQKAVAGCHW